MPARRKQQQRTSPQYLPERLTPHAAYSENYFYAPLPPHPHLYYPYPPYGLPYPMPPTPVMKYPKGYGRRSPSPPPRDKLLKYLDNRHFRRFYWDVRASSETFQYKASPSSRPDYVSYEIMGEPAILFTKTKELRIICENFKWDIVVKNPDGGHVSMRNVLDAIYGTLQEPLKEAEWGALSTGEKRNAHISRGHRIMLDKVSFAVDGGMKRIDTLGDKTIFSGLREDDATDAWVLVLSYRPRNGK